MRVESIQQKNQRKAEAASMADLMTRVAEQKDKAAFQELFAFYGPRLKGFMIAKGAAPEVADDLAQEAMLTVWRKAHMFNAAKGSVTTWIYTVARNLRIDRLRRESSLHFSDMEQYDEPDDAPISDEQIITGERAQMVTEAMSRLPDEQMEIIKMAFVEDLPQREIAEKLKLPLGTVKSRMRLAYQKMRAHLEDNL